MLNDFQVLRHVKRKASVQPNVPAGIARLLRDSFEHVGRLEKKNKRGIFIESRGYLNQLHFGLLNMKKSILIYLCNRQDQTFQIGDTLDVHLG